MQLDFCGEEFLKHGWSLLHYGITHTRSGSWLGDTPIQIFHVHVQGHRFRLFRQAGVVRNPTLPLIETMLEEELLRVARLRA